MRLLSIINLSNREVPGCDSGVIFHRLLFGRLSAEGWECVVASPIDLDIPGVRHVGVESGYSKYDVRFRFDWDAYAAAIRDVRPDCVFVHQCELVTNFRALLTTEGSSALLITYIHYWPVYRIGDDGQIEWDQSLNHSNLAEIILLRILEGVQACDICFVASRYSKELLNKAMARYNRKYDETKVRLLPCPADPFLMPEEHIGANSDSRQIIYNHRLYKQYGTEQLLTIIDSMREEDATFVITDFFAQRNSFRKALEPDVDRYLGLLKEKSNVRIRDDGDRRGVYRDDIIARSRVGLGPFRVNASWSMSSVDCLGMGIPVVCPRFASFPEFVPSPLLYSDTKGAIDLLRRLLVDEEFYQMCSREGRAMVREFHVDRVSRQFLRTIMG